MKKKIEACLILGIFLRKKVLLSFKVPRITDFIKKNK